MPKSKKTPNKGGKRVSPGEFRRVEASDFVSIYANNANGGGGFYDMLLVFGQLLSKPGTKDPYIEDRVAITMAWEHVGPLRDLLDRLLKKYVGTHGQVRQQPAIPKTSNKKK